MTNREIQLAAMTADPRVVRGVIGKAKGYLTQHQFHYFVFYYQYGWDHARIAKEVNKHITGVYRVLNRALERLRAKGVL